MVCKEDTDIDFYIDPQSRPVYESVEIVCRHNCLFE